MPEVDFDVYLISDRHQCRDEDLFCRVERALCGGVRAVQFREKDLSTRERFELGVALRGITSEFGAKLFVNGDAALARAIRADGVHLPVEGLPVDVCRKVLGPEMFIGVSTHSIDEAKEAKSNGADFVTYGPVFYTQSKAMYGSPVGLESLRTICAKIGLPVFALGGVGSDNIEDVISAGARGVAMISAILAADDVRSAAAQIAECVRRTRSSNNLTKKEG